MIITNLRFLHGRLRPWEFHASLRLFLSTTLLPMLVPPLVAAQPVHAATITVTSTADIVASDGQCTLREAIIAANTDTTTSMLGECEPGSGADTVKLQPAAYTLTIAGTNEDQSATGDLDVTGALTMEGDVSGTTVIEGTDNFGDRIIHIQSTTVEIRGVTIRNGTILGNGGGLRNQRGAVTLIDCAVIGNKTTKAGSREGPADTELGVELRVSGGGIFNTGTLRLVRSNVNENTAAGPGGGIASDIRSSTVIVEQNSVLSKNKTVNGSGGGIFINRGTLEATNSRIVDNRSGDPSSPDFLLPASADAGGIGTDKRSSRASLFDVTLSGNSALEDGGAIENEAGTMELTNCLVSNNRAEKEEGGGIENDRGVLTIRNSRIVNNTSATRGGGIHNANGRLQMIESTVSHNNAETRGGGIYNRENPFLNIETGLLEQSTPSQLTITNSTLSHNRIQEGTGGGIANASGALATLINSTVARNTIFSALVVGGGGAIANFGTMAISHSTIALNRGTRAGGAIANGGELVTSGTIFANQPFFNCSQFSSLISAGYNLSTDSSCEDLNQIGDQNGVTAGLDPSGLQNNGGPTETIALLSNSLAIDAANPLCTFDDDGEPDTPEVSLNTDQRGFTRPVDGNGDGGSECDIGAFERGATPPPADLSVTATDPPAQVIAGNNLTFTLDVSNNGPNDATGVTVTGMPTTPVDVAFVSATASQGTCARTDSVVTCNLGNLASGANASITIIVRPTAAGIIRNTASVSANEPDPDNTNNRAEVGTTVNPAPPSADLSISAESPPAVTVGNNLTFTLNVRNNGPDSATGVTVRAMPLTTSAGVQFISAAPSSCVRTGSIVNCNLGNLARGANASVRIVVRPTASGILRNTATVKATEPDPNNTNNTDLKQTTVNPVP